MKKNVRKKIGWYANRLRAMNVGEICWRLGQKLLQATETHKYANKTGVCEVNHESDALESFNADFLGLQFNDIHRTHHIGARPKLLGGYRYEDYATMWHAGFQTANNWPLKFAYKLNIQQRTDIGDVRLNWELNRHHQFPLMAMDYVVSNNKNQLDELCNQFYDWNRKNPFLWGVAWTSCMEVAIRAVQWMLTLAILTYAAQKKELEEASTLKKLRTNLANGIITMTEYVQRHRSRYSSANNHLIVEMAAVALAGIAFNRPKWQKHATAILNRELSKQNHNDGVNAEMSLHYHAFVMEAYLLASKALQANGISISTEWKTMLGKMAKFLRCSMISATHAMEFGDSDEGQFVNLGGAEQNYYRYILQFASLITGERYATFDYTETTINHLFTPKQINQIANTPPYTPGTRQTFASGGYTFLRNNTGNIVIGVDHGPLAYGSIAAHGHADAMSIQLYDDGEPVLIDGGTYLYHCTAEMRNNMRSELWHNTICYANHPQSEMLGAFLWGKKAKVGLNPNVAATNKLVVQGHTYDRRLMRRELRYNNELTQIEIFDFIQSPDDVVTFITPSSRVEQHDNDIVINNRWHIITHEQTVNIEKIGTSTHYGILTHATAIRLKNSTHGNSYVIIKQDTTT